MGGGKGSSGSVTQKTVAEPWKGVRPFLKSGYQDLSDIYGSYPEGAPQYFPGQTVAPLSPYTQGAVDLQAGRALAGSPLTGAAQGQLTQTLRGDYLSPQSNPFLQSTINTAIDPLIQNYQDIITPGLTSQFARGGRFGGGLHADAQGRAAEGLLNQIGNISTNLAGQNYQQERQRQIQGMLFAPQLAQQDYFDINQLGAAGSILDAQRQAEINAEIDRFNYGQRAPFDFTSEYLGILNTAPGGTTSTTQSGPRPNPFTSALGGALSGFGMLGGPVGGLLGGGLGLLGSLF